MVMFWWTTVKGPNWVQWNFWIGLVVHICRVSIQTWMPSCIVGAGICPRFAASSCITSLRLISTGRCSWISCIIAWTWSVTSLQWYCSFVDAAEDDIYGSAPSTGKTVVHCIVSDVELFAAHSAIGNHFTQSSCWWFTNTLRYCSMLPFICSVWPSIPGLNPVDNLRSIPMWIHIWPETVEATWGPLSKTIVNRSPWQCTTSCTNNSANPEASSVVWQGMKCRIFESGSTTT